MELAVLAHRFCGISFAEFKNLDYSQLIPMMTRGMELTVQEKEHDYEVARLIVWFSLMPHSKKKLVKPTDVLTFPWEKKKPKEEIDLRKVDLRALVNETFNLNG